MQETPTTPSPHSPECSLSSWRRRRAEEGFISSSQTNLEPEITGTQEGSLPRRSPSEGGLSLSLNARAANFSCQVQLPECTRGERLASSPSSLLSLLSIPGSLLYLPAGGNTNPSVSSSSSSSLMMFYQSTWQNTHGLRGSTHTHTPKRSKIKAHSARRTGVGALTGWEFVKIVV